MVANLLQDSVHFAADAADRGIHMRLVHLLSFENRENIFHVTLRPVSLDDLRRLVNLQYPVQLEPFVNDCIAFGQVRNGTTA